MRTLVEIKQGKPIAADEIQRTVSEKELKHLLAIAEQANELDQCDLMTLETVEYDFKGVLQNARRDGLFE